MEIASMCECNIDESTKACKCSEDRFSNEGREGRKLSATRQDKRAGGRSGVEFSYHTSSGWTPANKKRRGAIIYPCTNQGMVNSGACFFLLYKCQMALSDASLAVTGSIWRKSNYEIDATERATRRRVVSFPLLGIDSDVCSSIQLVRDPHVPLFMITCRIQYDKTHD